MQVDPTMLRGEVYWADLTPRSGSEQSGRRPVVIVSRDALNTVSTWRSIIVVPLSTSARQQGRGLTAVALPRGAAGLREDSVALCHQVTTLDRSKLTTRLGALTESELDCLDQALRLALSLD